MHILSIDQGTTGTTTILVNKEGTIVDRAYKEITQHYPQPGWVEHDPEEIWQSVVETVNQILNNNKDVDIKGIGITNQRETTVLWDKGTGKPVHNAIVWQCRRTADICTELKQHEKTAKEKTGLPIDAYFSATKIKWILENKKPETGNLLFGTIDTWLIWKLTNGKTHATDYTNASRTLIYNIHTKEWDEELLQLFNIPKDLLPEVKKSIDEYGNVETKEIEPLNRTPILGVAGDQQAALVGHAGFNKGDMKNTYGTGCFLLMNAGDKATTSSNGLLTTLAVNEEGEPCFALEGAVFIAGAVVQWLRDELKLITDASESEAKAKAVENNNGTYLVPAFVGLGAPYWNSEARGTIVGLTRGTNNNHIVRAALESIAYQSNEIIKLMEEESKHKIDSLTVDGGATQNNFLMQFQSDISNTTIIRPTQLESTSLGAAFLAGIGAKVWTADDIKNIKEVDKTFEPNMSEEERISLLEGWQKAIRQTQAK